MYLGSPRMAEMVVGEKVTPRGDGRGEDAHRRSRDAATSWSRPTPRRSSSPSVTSPTCRRTGARRRRRRRPPSPSSERPVVRDRSRRREDLVRRQGPDRRDHRRRLVLRGPRTLGEGAGGRLRANRRARGRDRRQPAAAEGRRAVRRLGRQGGAVHHDLQRVQRPAAVPRRRPRVHDRHRGRAPGDHPPRGEDDQRRLGGDGAEALGDRAQGLRRRPLRDGGARVRARLLHRAAGRLDRRDGSRGGRQRGLLQPDPGDRRRGRAGGVRARASARSTRPTSTSCISPRRWSSTR